MRHVAGRPSIQVDERLVCGESRGQRARAIGTPFIGRHEGNTSRSICPEPRHCTDPEQPSCLRVVQPSRQEFCTCCQIVGRLVRPRRRPVLPPDSLPILADSFGSQEPPMRSTEMYLSRTRTGYKGSPGSVHRLMRLSSRYRFNVWTTRRGGPGTVWSFARRRRFNQGNAHWSSGGLA